MSAPASQGPRKKVVHQLDTPFSTVSWYENISSFQVFYVSHEQALNLDRRPGHHPRIAVRVSQLISWPSLTHISP